MKLKRKEKCKSLVTSASEFRMKEQFSNFELLVWKKVKYNLKKLEMLFFIILDVDCKKVNKIAKFEYGQNTRKSERQSTCKSPLAVSVTDWSHWLMAIIQL